MKIIEQWWKPWTVWISGLASTLVGVSIYLPEVEQAIPPGVYKALIVAIFVARLIQQSQKDAANP